MNRRRRVGFLLLGSALVGCRHTNPTPSTSEPRRICSRTSRGTAKTASTSPTAATASPGLPLNGGKSVITPAITGSGRGWQEWNTTAALMRDPSILRGPDGMFHLVWTVAWTDHAIGVAHSRDLIHWSEQTRVPVMEHEPDALNTWAPGSLLRRRDEAVRDRVGVVDSRPISRDRLARAEDVARPRRPSAVLSSRRKTSRRTRTPRCSTTAASARSTARSPSVATRTTSS